LIYINGKEKLDRIKLEKDNFYVVADFDKTLTDGNSFSTWEVLCKSGIADEEYSKKRKELYNQYRPIEIDTTIPEDEKMRHMEDWWKKHVHLFYEYNLKEDILKQAIKKVDLKYRKGAEEFLFKMKESNVPVVIISAGIGNIILDFLEETKTDYDNIEIVSNFIKFTEGIIDTFEGKIIHSFNKNIVNVSEDIKNDRKYILLLGDTTGDIKMVDEEKLNDTITVGFLDENIEESLQYYNNIFDIVITKNGTYDELSEILNI